MDMAKKLMVLQNVYAAAIAEAVNTYARLGQLGTIVAAKETRQAQTAPLMVQQLGITSCEEVFTGLSSIFGCANWTVESTGTDLIATATSCKLCALCKRMGGASPCKGWCIDPMTAMIRHIAGTQQHTVDICLESTLMEESQCKLKVTIGS